MELSEEARELRNAYNREYSKKYYAKNKKRILANQKKWRKNNPDKVKTYRKKEEGYIIDYWERKAQKLREERGEEIC